MVDSTVRAQLAPSASQLLWEHCGRPPSHKAAALPQGLDGEWSRCWVCAGETHGRGCPIAQWDGANFTGQTKVRLPRSQAICEPCLWVMARVSEVPGHGAREGQTCGPNWRNFSVLYAAGESLTIASKGDKPAIRAWLRRPHATPWFAAIADSGQKHVVPWCPINGAGSRRVLFEESPVALPADDAGWRIVDDLTALLTAGATKEEIDGGAYASALTRCEPEVRAFERAYGHLRGGAWFSLCLWLAQRDEAAVAERMARESEARTEKKRREREAAKKPRAKKPAKGA